MNPDKSYYKFFDERDMKITNAHRYILLLLVLIQMPALMSAQTMSKKSFIVIDIIADDSVMLHDASIEFSMNKNNINTNFAVGTDLYNFKITGAKTKLKIPLSSRLNYGRIEYVYNKVGTDRPLVRNNNLFIFQQGDTVELHLSDRKNGAFFSGKSAGRFNCIYKISNSDEILHSDRYNINMRLKDYAAAFDYRRYQLDSILRTQLHILNRFKGKITPEAYRLISVDCWGIYNQKLVEMYYTPFIVQIPGVYKTAKKMFISDYGHYKESFFTAPGLGVLLKSYQYADFLFKKDRAFAVIMNSAAEKSYYPEIKFQDINKAIDLNHNTGPLRDKLKLLAFYDIDRRRQADFIDFIDEAIKEAGNDPFKRAMLEFKETSATLANAYPFKLTDENDRVHQLKDFQGKVMVMDFWFTGCEGCMGMAKSLKPIISFFKSNPEVVFITVSLDRFKLMWLRSLADEKYCSKDEINLLAGMDRQSPIVKHYNIQGCPTLIIISKAGKIVSVAPPDPRTDPTAFVAMIKRSL